MTPFEIWIERHFENHPRLWRGLTVLMAITIVLTLWYALI